MGCLRLRNWTASSQTQLRIGDDNPVSRETRLLPTKEKKGSANKIDGIDALLLGLAAKMEDDGTVPPPAPMAFWA